MYKPKSEVPAFLEICDIAGLVKGAAQGEGLGNAFLSHIMVRKIVLISHTFSHAPKLMACVILWLLFDPLNPNAMRAFIKCRQWTAFSTCAAPSKTRMWCMWRTVWTPLRVSEA